MSFFDDLAAAVARCPDAPVVRLFLGWYASCLVAEDGRRGLGFVPTSTKEPHVGRNMHTDFLLSGSLVQLANLAVSPFPQEFAAATAACSALFPFPAGGFPPDQVMPCARGDRVAVLGFERELVPLMRDWGWKVAVFDDLRSGPDCFPQQEFPDGVRDAEWVWLTSDAIRDRWLISIASALREKKGCFLQGPGLPCVPGLFDSLGVTRLVVPEVADETFEETLKWIAVGGSPWICRNLEWKVYPA